MTNAVEAFTLFTDYDINLFREGTHYRLYEKFGAHEIEKEGVKGTYFAVWAPNAREVYVVGNFNGWNRKSHALYVRWDGSGIWEGFVPQVILGELYKYYIVSNTGELLEKGDPFALEWETAPKTASKIGTTWYEWKDEAWMGKRTEYNALDKPISVYEMHLGSWRRDPENPKNYLSYGQVADSLIPYIKEAGFTHVEFMPLMEHPYYPSWGYQITGYFAASARYGPPQELMYLIEQLHLNDIGVIFDWVPSHFPGDANGLYKFDGTHLYEHADPRKGFHPDWSSYIFNYGRNEVRSFLISNALFWLDRYHADGLRVDAVASMLYLDYSRKEGEWIPNEYGGRENLEAISFLKDLNVAVYKHYPDVQTIAEESTAWPGVSRPVFLGGLGFGMKWMMGWMHDTLDYFREDPINRKFHHGQITFSTVYAFSENFMLPLSHDEVVHGKGSLISRMPGDEWQRFANLRAMYLYMFTHSGAKLLFMGNEFGQTSEWNSNTSLDWHLLEYAPHAVLFEFVKELNRLYRHQPALYERNFSYEGFEWVELGDNENSVLVYYRKGFDKEEDLVVILNLTPVVRYYYRIGLPQKGTYEIILNSDDARFGGSGVIQEPVVAEYIAWMNKDFSANFTLPPLGGLILKKKAKKEVPAKKKVTQEAVVEDKTLTPRKKPSAGEKFADDKSADEPKLTRSKTKPARKNKKDDEEGKIPASGAKLTRKKKE
ncbi:1,4-alpha-glucan branching protein GlgB [Olivibacter sitiensis]|uniref:1,4-alpha-glucan branching protein GlgB n=1 Tax=Olivibacter sitiensis TaxID=376470 RepID=UPI00040C423D|nr:1,4-alpha-glucan branching protein GlgB [Olivibacter sitiensis]